MVLSQQNVIMAYKMYKSVVWLRKRYVEEHKSIEEMAKEAGVASMTIRRALEEAGLIRR